MNASILQSGSDSLRVLLAGWWRHDVYEAALASGLTQLGCSVARFSLTEEAALCQINRLESRLRAGPNVRILNSRLLDRVRTEQHDVLFIYRCDLIHRDTLRAVRRVAPGCRIVAFHNDNPFTGLSDRVKWRRYLNLLPDCDLVCVYRPGNLEEAKRHGARSVIVLPPHFMSYRHRPSKDDDRGQCHEVLYVGHYEEDGRGELLDYLIRNGIPVRVFGQPGQWRSARKRYSWARQQEIRPLWGDAYARALSSSKIALVFLSGLNRDVWTRRCFEIPACGSLMVAPRTPELCRLFAEDREAVYYSGREELLEKTRYYLSHDEERRGIASAGRLRCLRDGHDEVARAQQILDSLNSVQSLVVGGVSDTVRKSV